MTRPSADAFTRINGTGGLLDILSVNHFNYLLPQCRSSLGAGASRFPVNPQCLALSRKAQIFVNLMKESYILKTTHNINKIFMYKNCTVKRLLYFLTCRV